MLRFIHIEIRYTDSENTFPRNLSPEVLQALRGVRFIAQHIKDADKDNEVSKLITTGEICFFLLVSMMLWNRRFLSWFCFIFYADCRRLEVRVDGVGSLFIVGIYTILHWWHTRNYISKSVVVWHTSGYRQCYHQVYAAIDIV